MRFSAPSGSPTARRRRGYGALSSECSIPPGREATVLAKIQRVGHFDERFDVAERDEHAEQQEDALTTMISGERRHERIADRSLSFLNGLRPAAIEVSATQRASPMLRVQLR